MKKNKFLELQKHLGGSYEDAKIIADFINKLTPDWFEQYITDFFMQDQFWFHAVRNGGFNDKWIDVKAARTNEDWSRTFLIVQCKKWEAYHIKENDLAMFYGKVVDTARTHDCKIIFVATTWFTIWAKEFCEQKKIDYVDYKWLLEFNLEFPLDAWIKQMQHRSDKENYLEAFKSEEDRYTHGVPKLNQYVPKYWKFRKWKSPQEQGSGISEYNAMKLLFLAAGIFVWFCIFVFSIYR